MGLTFLNHVRFRAGVANRRGLRGSIVGIAMRLELEAYRLRLERRNCAGPLRISAVCYPLPPSRPITVFR